MLAESELSKLLCDYPIIHVKILELFSEPDVALRWLKSPKIQLCGATPLSTLERAPKQVEDLIYRIETGDRS